MESWVSRFLKSLEEMVDALIRRNPEYEEVLRDILRGTVQAVEEFYVWKALGVGEVEDEG